MHERLLSAIRLFNEEKFFDAHESMEKFWQEYSGADRVYYQALIQLTVALHLYQNSRLIGAQKVLARAIENMTDYQGPISGIDLIKLRDEVIKYLADSLVVPKIKLGLVD